MTVDELARLLDHSVLKPEATEAEVRAGARVVAEWRIGFYCVQPVWVRCAVAALGTTASGVVSVVGFPHGCEHTRTKADAASRAVDDGATEIDMVIGIGALKGGDARFVAADIDAVVKASGGASVKVILETGILTDDEKRLACRLVRDAGAAFVKTSTGFHASGGATLADVALMRSEVGPQFGVKASGGIRTLADTRAMIDAGATRIGTSASIAILAALDGGKDAGLRSD
ncbi:MAG: deoxyribose-phosphate aldolase [Burkholderiales bacterium]|nr:deoxyribose-phosphate aldolase [Burkholderiales bacterium]